MLDSGARFVPPPAEIGLKRWWIYQRERFPIVAHGALIAAFSSSAVSYSQLARGQVHVPGARTLVVAFVSSLLFFFQLRIADEFKDREEDARYRPYRPVPRGLVSLRELGTVGAISAVIQLGLALWLSASLVPLLFLVWAYLALMCKEFFCRDWLKARPITYMWTHMLIMPLVDLYVTSCDWRPAAATPPPALIWLLVVSFWNGIVLEIGRKIRAPRDEERGVQTYTALWGRTPAVAVWMGALLITAAGAWMAASRVGFGPGAALLLAGLFLIALTGAARFLRVPETSSAGRIERLSGLWTLLMYLCIGIIPLVSTTW